MRSVACLVMMLTFGYFLPVTVLADSNADVKSKVTVYVSAGKRVKGHVDARSSEESLFVRFGSGRSTILRRITWRNFESAERNGQQLSKQQLLELAATVRDEAQLTGESQTAVNENQERFHQAGRAQAAPSILIPLVTHIQSDVAVANWDADAEVDGLLIHLRPMAVDWHVVPVAGSVTVTLSAKRHAPFHDVPHGRGEVRRVVKQWRVRVDPLHVTSEGAPIQLPFDVVNPATDDRWALPLAMCICDSSRPGMACSGRRRGGNPPAVLSTPFVCRARRTTCSEKKRRE